MEDEVILIKMGRTLKAKFPGMITLHEVPGCGHNEIVMDATESIGAARVEIGAARVELADL